MRNEWNRTCPSGLGCYPGLAIKVGEATLFRMPVTLGSTAMMREIPGSGSRTANSSITRRLRRLKIDDPEKPETIHEEFQRLRREIRSDLGSEE
jgi:hypothetical protein